MTSHAQPALLGNWREYAADFDPQIREVLAYVERLEAVRDAARGFVKANREHHRAAAILAPGATLKEHEARVARAQALRLLEHALEGEAEHG